MRVDVGEIPALQLGSNNCALLFFSLLNYAGISSSRFSTLITSRVVRGLASSDTVTFSIYGSFDPGRTESTYYYSNATMFIKLCRCYNVFFAVMKNHNLILCFLIRVLLRNVMVL